MNSEKGFYSQSGVPVPALTEAQMREVDRIAMEDFGLGILQMMENAGRNLALNAMDMLEGPEQKVAVLAGTGGNGGGGLCGARHLHNRGFLVSLVLSQAPEKYTGAAGEQLNILRQAGLRPASSTQAQDAIRKADLVVDALIGYSLKGPPRGRTRELIELCNRFARKVLSLDLPSGVNATSGEIPGEFIHPSRTMTLALPKWGLLESAGEVYLADIGIPGEVYHPLGIQFEPFWGSSYYLRLMIK